MIPSLILGIFLVFLVGPGGTQNLTEGILANVTQNLAVSATHSWEYGTRAEALLELYASSFSVFSPIALPPPSTVPSSVAPAISPVFSIAQNIVANRSNSNHNITGPQPLIADGAAGDPASIGVAVLLANWTGQGSISGLDYAGAAQDQLDFLYQNVSKTSDGAISHRTDQLQLWSDFVYMVPPFLAYYGVLTQNQSLLMDAYTQISLYRNYLRDTNARNLWKHIVLGNSGTDPGHWSTGNGWAAAGMLRVLATIKRSQYASSMKSQQSDLASWVKEIHAAMYSYLDSTNLFLNYADQNQSSTNFYDASSTALLASTVYRISLLSGDHSHLPYAQKTRATLINGHIDSDGWLNPVVNPDEYGDEGTHSPESEAFMLEMQAAWSDWVANGSKGANAASRLTSVGQGWMWAWLVAGLTFVTCI